MGDIGEQTAKRTTPVLGLTQLVPRIRISYSVSVTYPERMGKLELHLRVAMLGGLVSASPP